MREGVWLRAWPCGPAGRPALLGRPGSLCLAAVGCSQVRTPEPEHFCRKMLSSFQNAMRTLVMGINNRWGSSCY